MAVRVQSCFRYLLLNHRTPMASLLMNLENESSTSLGDIGLDIRRSFGSTLCIKGHFTHETKRAMTVTLQAPSLVERAEPIQVRFTLRLRDRQSM